MKTSEEATFITTREAARRLGVSLRTAQLWTENGLLDAWKTEGGHRRIRVESVDRVLRQGAARPERATPESRPFSGGDRIKVLIVEDDNILLKLYRLRFDAWQLPIDVLTVSNGCEGLILVGRERPDLMIVDLMLPYLDGVKMVRTIENSPFREGMEMVAVSGLEKTEVEAMGGLPDSVPLFPKPVPFDALREVCERLLRRRRTARQALERGDFA